MFFSDPSVLGLFFVGGMLLLEKEQGILQSIVVTPLRPVEYVTGKILSLSLVALFAGFLITKLSITQSVHYGLLFIGILLTSCFFTQMGILVACRSKSINAFFLKMVPLYAGLHHADVLADPLWGLESIEYVSGSSGGFDWSTAHITVLK